MNLNQIIYKIKNRWLFAIPLILSFNSCISNKDYIYLQNKTNTSSKDSNETFVNHSNPYKLKPNDILYVKLVTEDEKMNALFNPMGSGSQTIQLIQQPGSTGTPFYFMGYSLDQDGNLELPYLGKLNLAGKNVEEAKFIMETEVKKYFKTFFLQVKLAEFRFSILGAINRPGQYYYMVNKLNILEALAMAADVSEIGKRNQLTLIREENGKTQIHQIDLTDKNLLNTPYYQIHPNDIIYVQPVKSRSVGNLSNFQGTLSTILPLFSTFLLVLNTYIILQNIK